MRKLFLLKLFVFFLLISCNQNNDRIADLRETIILCERDIMTLESDFKNNIDPKLSELDKALQYYRTAYLDASKFTFGRTEDEKMTEMNSINNRADEIRNAMNDLEISKKQKVDEIERLNQALSDNKIELLKLEQ